MSNGTLPYQNPTIVDSRLDVEDLTVDTVVVKRERVQLTGRNASDIARVTAEDGVLTNLATNGTATYEACFSVVAAGSGDAVQLLGSGSKVVRLLELYVSEPSVARLFKFVKRSSAASGGAFTAEPPTPLDSNNASATATLSNYSAVPSAGALVDSPLFIKQLSISQHVDKSWVDGGGQVPTLRGVSEAICVNVNGAVNFHCYVRWVESST